MERSYKVGAGEQKKLREEMRKTKKAHIYRRLEAVALLSEGMKPMEISKITGYHEKTVRQFGYLYNEKGIEALATDGRKGGNHRVMKEEDAKVFLAHYQEKAERGEIITIKEMGEELNKATGKERSSQSTIYAFLHSHGWRKVMPRSRHPEKASEEEIESSKKLTIGSAN